MVGGQLKIIEGDLLETKGVMAALSKFNIQLTQTMIFDEQIGENIEQLGRLHTNGKTYQAAFLPIK